MISKWIPDDFLELFARAVKLVTLQENKEIADLRETLEMTEGLVRALEDKLRMKRIEAFRMQCEIDKLRKEAKP